MAKLPTTVESYGKTWPTTPDQMETYKQGLYIAFETTFLRNFEARCAVPINNAVDVLEQEMLSKSAFRGFFSDGSSANELTRSFFHVAHFST